MSSISAGTTTTTGYVVTSDTTGALVLKTGASGTTAVTIDTSQNVGIGTGSPARKLVVSNAGAAQLAWVPLQFWFCKNPGLAIPLISLQYHEVTLIINLANLDEIETVSCAR